MHDLDQPLFALPKLDQRMREGKMPESSRPRPGRKPTTPSIKLVLDAIVRGDYDEDILKLSNAVQTRNDARKKQVMELVHEVFGNSADVVLTRDQAQDEMAKPTRRAAMLRSSTKSVNPFFQVSSGTAKAAESESREVLPGPYRRDPINGNALRAASPPDAEGFLNITDIFGDHGSRVLQGIWETWEELPDDEDVPLADPISDSLRDLDSVEAKMAVEQSGAQPDPTPSEQAYVPPEQRGAIISGLHSSDMGN